jgi:hypothetical protein
MGSYESKYYALCICIIIVFILLTCYRNRKDSFITERSFLTHNGEFNFDKKGTVEIWDARKIPTNISKDVFLEFLGTLKKSLHEYDSYSRYKLKLMLIELIDTNDLKQYRDEIDRLEQEKIDQRSADLTQIEAKMNNDLASDMEEHDEEKQQYMFNIHNIDLSKVNEYSSADDEYYTSLMNKLRDKERKEISELETIIDVVAKAVKEFNKLQRIDISRYVELRRYPRNQSRTDYTNAIAPINQKQLGKIDLNDPELLLQETAFQNTAQSRQLEGITNSVLLEKMTPAKFAKGRTQKKNAFSKSMISDARKSLDRSFSMES